MQNELLKKIVLDSWNSQLNTINKLLATLSDEKLTNEIAPGKNSGVYILGHLTAVHDFLFPLLGIGEKLHPELEEIFIKNPDKSTLQKPSTTQLREYWNEVNTLLSSKLSELTIEEFFGRHNSVSEEDFKKEPHRNRMNVILNRTSHLAYHGGQLVLLKN